jgi:sec-independent protein translocase protein TatB
VGFSLGEIILFLIVGLIVVGPRRLPGLMRTAGQWVARLRRMSTDLRSQSGIDDLIRQEGLEQHLTELRSLSRMNVVDTLIAPAGAASAAPAIPATRPALGNLAARKRAEPLREREYPLVGCDACGALPDDALPYIPPRPHAPVEPVDAQGLRPVEPGSAPEPPEAPAAPKPDAEASAPAAADAPAPAPADAPAADAPPAAAEQAEGSDA